MDKKKIFKKVLSLLLVIGVLAPTNIFATSTSVTTGVVKKNFVALRKNPAVPKVSENIKDKATIEKIQNANIIGPLMKGDVVTVLKPKDKNGWTYVQVSEDSSDKKVSGKKGYVADYSLDIKTNASTNSNQTDEFVTVKKATKFMKKPERSDKKSDIYYTLGAGNKVKLLGVDKNGWAKIENLAGTIGHCDARHLNITNKTTANNSTTNISNNVTANNSTTNISNNVTANTSQNKDEATAESTSDKYSVSVSSYTTTIATAKDGRRHNVELASSRVHKTVLMPGEELNLKNLIADKNGRITREDGYQTAPVFVNQERKPGVGGGICQVATTIYQAALHGNFDITESLAHSMKVGYVEPGMDASYATGAKNLRFKNNKQYPVEINVVVNGSKLTAEIKSTHDVNNGYKYKVHTKEIDSSIYHTYLDEIAPDGTVTTELKRISRYYR